MEDGAGLRAQNYREMSAHFRALAELEPVAALRRYLQRLAAQHDAKAAELETVRTTPSLAAD